MATLFSEMDRTSTNGGGGAGSGGGGGVNGTGGGVIGGVTNGIGGGVSVAGVGTTPNSLEEQRALQLAFELSMLGFTDTLNGVNDLGGGCNVINNQHHQQMSSLGSPNGCMLSAFSTVLPNIDERSKKSQNMTECVPVPSSEHVAEIVGRQGCKIKALRAKTNTYIKTPVRGEEPVFVVTGRKEDVAKAKREILSAAEHFSLIRASRKPALGGLSGKGTPPGPPTNIPGQITIQVRVPYRVVGLVVGPKGATIKHIQQQTHTYIVTPSRDKEPVFEVTGMPDNVQSARRQIEAHIALRTGNASLNSNGLSALLSEDNTPELLASLYKNGLGSLFGYLEPNVTDTFAALPSSTGSSTCESSSSSTSSKSAVITRPELINIWKSLGESIDVDEGLGESPNIWSMPASSVLGSHSSPSASVSPTDSLLAGSMCKRECLVCGDKEVTAALVPCGHNMFCLDCANRICGSNDSTCPICSQTVIQAIRIIA